MNLKITLRQNSTKSFLWLLTVLSTALATYAQPGCDPAFINALRDFGYETEANDVALTIMKNVCSGSSRSGGFNYVKDTTKIGGSAKSVEQACTTKDYQFFETYRKELMYSRLPQGVLQGIANCFGESVYFTATTNDDNIELRAGHRPIGMPPAKIRNFTWEPKNAMTCSGQEWKPGFQLKINGDVLICRRTRNVALSIAMNLTGTGGGKTLSFTTKPVFERVSWSIVQSPNGNNFKCVNQFGEADKNWVPLDRRLLMQHATGTCYTRYGHSTVHYGDNKRTYIRETWKGEARWRGKPYVICVLDGRDYGDIWSVKVQGGRSRPDLWDDICASLYRPIQDVDKKANFPQD
ncbi:MAG: hypothetical protein LUM44_08925 [Pyrinomonadaceae bacterium]|nr:hypothetical protein [Pyrinomonadaceae bacterium]